jgi:acetyl-CoA carboxylase carboxyltransferase component
MVGPAVEETALLRHSIRPVIALAAARVPYVTVVLRKAYGLAMGSMGSRNLGPLLYLVWPSAETGAMGREGAANILQRGGSESATVDRAAALERMRQTGGALGMAESLRADDAIDPAETREKLIKAFQFALSDQLRARGTHPVDPW